MSKAQKAIKSAQFWRPEYPYNELPLLPPGVELETKAVLKQCIGARAAIAELKQAAELIPNQGVLINTLPLLEAQASSEIENIVTTTDQLFQFREDDDNADADNDDNNHDDDNDDNGDDDNGNGGGLIVATGGNDNDNGDDVTGNGATGYGTTGYDGDNNGNR